MIIFEPPLKQVSHFEAAEVLLKIDWSLKPNQHDKLSLFKSLRHSDFDNDVEVLKGSYKSYQKYSY